MRYFSSCPLAPMIRLLLAVLLLTFRLPAAAQAPAWQSARAVAGDFSQITATAIDSLGNVYLVGNFTNTLAIGAITLTSLGSYDVFVAKFNPASNQFVWAQRAGGTDEDFASAVAVSGNNVYVVGSFRSPTAGFGVTSLATTGRHDIFVTKLTDAGRFVWTQQAGGPENDIATAMAVNGTSVYLAGRFSSSVVSFGSTTLSLTASSAPFSSDVFVTKLTDAGSTSHFVWAQQAGGTQSDVASALAVSGTSVYIAGSFTGSASRFGTTTLAGATFSADVFVAKLTDAGTTSSFVWAQRAGGAGVDHAFALVASGNNVYVTGAFGINSPTADFGADTLTTAGSFDVFITKLTDTGSTGRFVWTQQAGGADSDQPYNIAVRGTSVYVSGYFTGLMARFGSFILASAGADDIFVAKLVDTGSTGYFTWVQQAGGVGFDAAYALAASANNVYVAGSFDGSTTSFGAITLNNPAINALGFLASLTDPTLTATAATVSRESVSLSPNPAHHTAILHRPAGTAAPLTLADARGRTVRQYPAPAGSATVLDLRGLPAGLYLLRGAGPAQRLMVE